MTTEISQKAPSFLIHGSMAPGEATVDIPRPQHFITRGDGSITPLIAVDELPESIRIVGVPAVISQATTLNMVDLGFLARSSTKYIVEMPEDSGSGNTGNISQKSTTTESLFHLQRKRLEPLVTAVTAGRNNASGGREVEQWRLGVNTVHETQATIDAVVAASAKPQTVHSARTPKALTPGVFGEKKYCTHWIRWGECDYMQQGCKYKHEMPDEETLVSIGIRTMPKWYKEANPSKSAWVEQYMPYEGVWREPPSHDIQRLNPYQLSYPSGSGLFRASYLPSKNSFRPPYQPSPDLFQPYGPVPRSVPGSLPKFSNGLVPHAFHLAPGVNDPMGPISHQHTPHPPKFLGFKNKIGSPSTRFPTVSSSPHRGISASTRNLASGLLATPVFPAAASTAGSAPAPASAPAPLRAQAPPQAPSRPGPPPTPFSPPLTTQPLSPTRLLPTTLAPVHRALLPFLPPLESVTLPPTPLPEIKSPAPRHRRLFVAPGESAYVENGMSGDKKSSRTVDGEKWEELGKGIEELLVDFGE